MGLFSLVHLFVNEFRSRWERSIGFLPLIQTSVGEDYWVSSSYPQVGGSGLLGFSLLFTSRWERTIGFLPLISRSVGVVFWVSPSCPLLGSKKGTIGFLPLVRF